jgi:hypothetical protein
MSTLVHVPNSLFDIAMTEILRVLRAGAPLAIGVWAGVDSEDRSGFDVIEPPRFFSLRSDDTLTRMLGRHGTMEHFATWTRSPERGRYQYAVLRKPG